MDYKEVDIYVYDPITNEFLYQDKSDRNPLDPETPIIPACSTTVKPKYESKEGYAIVWAGNKWNQVEDHRGETWYNTTTEQPEVISILGDIPDIYVSTDSARANKPDGDYWEYDSDLDRWVANVTKYKQELVSLVSEKWEEKFNQEFNFNNYYYLPSWKTLYLEIYTTLKEGIKDTYRLRDNHGQYNTVDVTQMKTILACMSDVVDKLYIEKQDLQDYIIKQKDYYKIREAYNKWLVK